MVQKREEKKMITESLDLTEQYMKNKVGLGESFDLGVRKIKILKKDVHVYYVNGLCDTAFIIQLLKELVNINNNEKLSTHLYEIIENRLIHQSVNKVKTLDELVIQVLSGLIVVVVEGETEGLVIDVRGYPGRQPQEPDTEKVVRGARDGYTENIIINTALTRRRIRDEKLRFEIMKVGERSKTDIAIGYIEDVADPDLVQILKKELKAINTDGLTMGDKTVEEFMLKQGYNPFPLVRYSERPDVVAAHILEGHAVIFVDTSPSVIITPTTFFHHVQHAEEYRQSPAVGTFVRWIRFLGILTSIFLLPLWLLFVLEPEMLPKAIDFIGPSKRTNIPMVAQLFFADLGLEFLRMASVHTPTSLSTAMGLIAAVLIGQIAIDVGLFVPEVILYVAIAGIGSFMTPSYELGIANKMIRLLLLALVAIFHAPGFIVGVTVYILSLARVRSLNIPYLWPFIPFSPKALWHILIRQSVPGSSMRPSITHARNRFRKSI